MAPFVPMNRLRINVLGVGLNVLNLESARDAIAAAIEKKEKGYVCVTGVHGVTEAQSDPEFRRILNQSFLTTPDGMPMVWVGKLHGHGRAMSRVYGPDLMLKLCAWSQNHPCRHFFYGGAPGVAEMLKQKLQTRFPGMEVAGTYCPPFRPLDPEEEGALQATFDRLQPDLTWIGLSTPKQERFMSRYLPLLNTTIMIGVGAAFDFHSGRVRQAPRWIQRSGMEWLFRFYQDPRRLAKRYFTNNPLFAGRIFCQLTGLRKYPLE